MNLTTEMKTYLASMLEEQTKSIAEMEGIGELSDESVWALVRNMDLTWERAIRNANWEKMVVGKRSHEDKQRHPAIELFINKMRFQLAYE